MKKITVNYDEATGNVTGDNGFYIGYLPSSEFKGESEAPKPTNGPSIAELNSMKMAGWDVGAVVTMKKEGLL